MTKNRSAFIWFLLAALAVVVYFSGLNIPLLGPDEPRYAQVAREMFERGDWITPTLGGFDWFEKPALLYWLQIISYHLFGVSEFAARFGSALFGLGTIFCLWILGKRFSVFSSQFSVPKNLSFANWLALIAASSVGLIVFSHAASFDIILTFPLTAALVGFFLFEQAEKKSGFTFYFCLFAFYFFTGVALIGKGLVGIVFPFAIVAFYYFLSWKLPNRIFVFSLLWGTILCLAVAAVWYLPMYQANGWKFIDEFFIQHHFQRYLSNKYQHPQPFYYFFWVLPLMTLPWLPFFLAALLDFFRQIFRGRNDGETHSKNNKKETRFFPLLPVSLFLPVSLSPLLALAFAWLVVPLVFFSLSGSKLPGYILPALPAALILTADYVCRFADDKPRRRVFLQLAAAAVFVGSLLVLQFFTRMVETDETVKNLIVAANADGYAGARILHLYKPSYNAEFYGAGRIARTPDGSQKIYYGATEIYDAVKNTNETVLVLVPLDGVKYLTENDSLTTKVLGDNGETAIAAVSKRAE